MWKIGIVVKQFELVLLPYEFDTAQKAFDLIKTLSAETSFNHYIVHVAGCVPTS